MYDCVVYTPGVRVVISVLTELNRYEMEMKAGS